MTGPSGVAHSAGAERAATHADPEVAEVDGAPILASEVAAEARRTGASPAEALDRVIRFQLVVAEAERRGLERDPDVVEARDQAAVRALLRDRFTARFHASDIPEEDVRRAYAHSGFHFRHPALMDVTHLIVQVPSDSGPALEARALAAAHTLRRMAEAQNDDAAFRALATALPGDALGVHIASERLQTAREGVTQEPFAAAAFALGSPGALGGPVRSTFGWHVLRLDRRIAPLDVPLAEAEAEIRAKLFPFEQKKAFLAFYQSLADRHRIVEHPEALAETASSSAAAAGRAGETVAR